MEGRRERAFESPSTFPSSSFPSFSAAAAVPLKVKVFFLGFGLGTRRRRRGREGGPFKKSEEFILSRNLEKSHKQLGFANAHNVL